VDIQSPDFETRLAILRKKCDESELVIPEEVLEYLRTVAKEGHEKNIVADPVFRGQKN